MRKIYVFCICIMILCTCVAGCSTTQCANGQKALASAQVAYDTAVASGNAKQIEQYGWTLNAAQAIVDIWCSTQGE